MRTKILSYCILLTGLSFMEAAPQQKIPLNKLEKYAPDALVPSSLIMAYPYGIPQDTLNTIRGSKVSVERRALDELYHAVSSFRAHVFSRANAQNACDYNPNKQNCDVIENQEGPYTQYSYWDQEYLRRPYINSSIASYGATDGRYWPYWPAEDKGASSYWKEHSYYNYDSPSYYRYDSPSYYRYDSPSYYRYDSPSYYRYDSPSY